MRRVPPTIVSNISRRSRSSGVALEYVAAWMTCENAPSVSSNVRTSPSCSVTAGWHARCGALLAKALPSLVSTTAEASSLRWSFAHRRVSSSQQPKNPVPPVTNTRAPRSSSHSPLVCAST